MLTYFKFTPEDFLTVSMQTDANSPTQYGPTLTQATRLAAAANARLREWLDAAPTKAIDELVNRFLAWPLPQSVRSDPCVIDKEYPHRIGTNLLTADEARQMFEHVLVGARLVCVERLEGEK